MRRKSNGGGLSLEPTAWPHYLYCILRNKLVMQQGPLVEAGDLDVDTGGKSILGFSQSFTGVVHGFEPYQQPLQRRKCQSSLSGSEDKYVKAVMLFGHMEQKMPRLDLHQHNRSK